MLPVAILAGGAASRLRPLTEATPKSLVEVAGKPFIVHQLNLLRREGVERAVLVAPVLLVLIVELLNSAIEATVDRIGLERHELAGLAKDIGSAAVLMSFVLVAVVWVLVLTGR